MKHTQHTPTDILRMCLEECNGDPLAGLLAAEHVLSMGSHDYCSEDNYPRNNSNQFIRKHLLVEAARDVDYYLTLRNSIPESEQGKLDAVITALQSGETIHHPRESPDTAVNMDGDMPNATAMIYREVTSLRSEWQEKFDTLTKTLSQVVELLNNQNADKEIVAAFMLDQQGHDHRGKGDSQGRGGQFAPKGGGGGGSTSSKSRQTPKVTPRPNTQDPQGTQSQPANQDADEPGEALRLAREKILARLKKPQLEPEPEPDITDDDNVDLDPLDESQEQPIGPTEAGKYLYSLTPEQLAAGQFSNFGIGGEVGNSLNAKAIGTVNVGGQPAFWKGIGSNLANHESYVASLFEKAGLRTPAVRAADIPNAPVMEGTQGGGMVAELIQGETLGEKLRSVRYSFDEVEKNLRPGEADRHALFAFLLSIGDRHEGNYMVEGDRLVSIDHEFSLGRVFLGRDRPPLELLDLGENAIQYITSGILENRFIRDEHDDDTKRMLNPNAVNHIAGVADEIAGEVERADPQRGMLVRRHAEALKRYATSGDYSLASLQGHLKNYIDETTPKVELQGTGAANTGLLPTAKPTQGQIAQPSSGQPNQ